MTRLTTAPSAREQVHHALTLLGVPAATWLIVETHSAFLPGDLSTGRIAELRREEERGFDADPHARPFYLCPALGAADLAPARGVLALSTWPLASRIITVRGARTDLLTATVRVAELAAGLAGVGAGVDRLLRRLAVGVPGGVESYDVMRPRALAEAARAALAGDADAARAERDAAATRAEATLDARQRLFGFHPPGAGT